jgi:CDP-diacylglycerol--glycerol-3-phosphate 3-phosphatidyltransferase
METTTDQGQAAADIRNLPNLLTLLRIAAVPLVVWLLRDPGRGAATWAFWVYLVASLTDYFDGYLARRWGLVTALGKLLDPLADKLLVVSALIMLALLDRSPGIPGWLLVVIVGRELAVTGLRGIAATEGIVLGAEATGKIKTVLQIVGVHALILHYDYFGIPFYEFGMVVLGTSVAFGLWSAVDYHLRVFRELAARSAP